MNDFQDQFVANKGQPINHDGHLVHIAVRLAVTPGDELRIRLLRTTGDPIQGLKIRADGAVMAAMSDVGMLFVVWEDTAPPESVVTIQNAKPGATVTLRNVWKEGPGAAMMQGLRFAGMMCETDESGRLVLRCSDGCGEPDFDDLIAVVSHKKGAVAAPTELPPENDD